jgi:tetratricopeptide (TPR) repeat protein
MQKADFDGAIADCSEELFLDASSSSTWSRRARVKLCKRDYHGAIADCSEALNLDRTNRAAWAYRGEARVHINEMDGAVADCNEALFLSPKLRSAFGNRAKARLETGDYAGAVSDASKALELDVAKGLEDKLTGGEYENLRSILECANQKKKYMESARDKDSPQQHAKTDGSENGYGAVAVPRTCPKDIKRSELGTGHVAEVAAPTSPFGSLAGGA